MNTKLSIAAITLVAVIMGLSVLAPAVASGPQGKTDLCHNDDGDDGIRGNADDFWETINVNQHSVVKHELNHADINGVKDFAIPVSGTQAECDILIAADPDPTP